MTNSNKAADEATIDSNKDAVLAAVAQAVMDRQATGRPIGEVRFKEVVEGIFADDELLGWFQKRYGSDIDRIIRCAAQAMTNAGFRVKVSGGPGQVLESLWDLNPPKPEYLDVDPETGDFVDTPDKTDDEGPGAPTDLRLIGRTLDGQPIYRDELGQVGTITWEAI